MVRSVQEQSAALPWTGERTEQQRQVEQLGPWFHNLHLPDGTQTAPNHVLGDFPRFKWQQIAPHLPADLTGWRALDIGCNAGFYTLELARRGADVLGIDHDRHYLEQARWAAEQFQVEDRITLRQMQVYDLMHVDEMFDLVLFMGVFYHLRYPLLALDLVAERVRRLMVFQTMLSPSEGPPPPVDDRSVSDRQAMVHPAWPKMAFIESYFAGDPTNWWMANASGVEAMLRSSGMDRIEELAPEIWLCQPARRGAQAARYWDQAELLAATGRSRPPAGDADVD